MASSGTRPIARAALLGGVLLLGGCSYVSEVIWPGLTGDSSQPQPARPAQSQQAQAAPQAAPPPPPPQAAPQQLPPGQPPLGTGQFVPQPLTPGQATGTFVGQKVQQMRSELGQLQAVVSQRNGQLQQIRGAAIQNSQRYHGTLAAITTKLQLGTTPGNPIVVSQWNQAQADLDRLASDVAAMSSLSNEVSADAALSSYLLDNAKATYGISGAIDEDHRQLAILEDETNRTAVLIDRLMNEVSQDVARQSSYVSSERSNLNTLSLAIKNGELYGTSLTNKAYNVGPAAGGGGPVPFSGPRAATGDGRGALVVIRFDRNDVAYQQSLYSAVSRALERRPNASFDLVAVAAAQTDGGQTASNQNQSRRNADRVLRTLSEMGLPASRVNVTTTTSRNVATNEVHIYVR